MDIIEIKGSVRAKIGKKATKALRRNEHVPCVVYGGKEPIHFEAHSNEFTKIVFTDKVYIVKLNIDGKEIISIMKDIQFNPITDKVRHIDFLEVNDKKAFVIDVPVNYVGQPVGALIGGNFNKRRRYLTIKGLLNNIPNTLDIDVTGLEIGQSLRIGDVKTTDVTIMDAPQLTLCSVNVSRLAMKTAEDEEGAEGEEGTEEAPAEAGDTPAVDGDAKE
jgi:large subunit ribosomal protein L25